MSRVFPDEAFLTGASQMWPSPAHGVGHWPNLLSDDRGLRGKGAADGVAEESEGRTERGTPPPHPRRSTSPSVGGARPCGTCEVRGSPPASHTAEVRATAE